MEKCIYCEALTDKMETNENPVCLECMAEFEAEYLSWQEALQDNEMAYA